MRLEILALAAIVGTCNYAFRFFPTRVDLSGLNPSGRVARFLASTGPAAIATLVVSSILPTLTRPDANFGPIAGGVMAVIAVFALTRSVVGATLAGSLAFGMVFAWLGS